MKPSKLKLSNTGTLVTIMLLAVILMAGIYYYFFNTLRKEVESSSSLANDTATLAVEENNLDSLRSTFSNTGNDQEKINSYFVQKDGAVDFINSIENLASSAHLVGKTDSVNTTDMTPPSPMYELLHLTFSTRGSWRNTYYFLSLLESLPYNISIRQVGMHSAGDTTIDVLPVLTPDLSASSSSSTVLTVVPIVTRPKPGSVWETNYDFTVVKLK